MPNQENLQEECLQAKKARQKMVPMKWRKGDINNLHLIPWLVF